MWIIKLIQDNRQKDKHHGWFVRGINAAREIPSDFSWNVPDLDHDFYCLDKSASQETRRLWEIARQPSGIRPR